MLSALQLIGLKDEIGGQFVKFLLQYIVDYFEKS